MTEPTPGPPHQRTYTRTRDGQTRHVYVDVDHRGITSITAELIDELLKLGGWTRTDNQREWTQPPAQQQPAPWSQG